MSDAAVRWQKMQTESWEFHVASRKSVVAMTAAPLVEGGDRRQVIVASRESGRR